MRVLAVILVLAASAPALAADNGPEPGATGGRECSRSTTHFASKSSVYRGQPMRPKTLTELPPGISYMAVLRRIGGCEVPLTMIEYRNNPRRR